MSLYKLSKCSTPLQTKSSILFYFFNYCETGPHKVTEAGCEPEILMPQHAKAAVMRLRQ